MAEQPSWSFEPVDHDPFAGESGRMQELLDYAAKLAGPAQFPEMQHSQGFDATPRPDYANPLLPTPLRAVAAIPQALADQVQGVGRVLALPGQVARGEVNPLSPEGLARTNELGALMVGQGFAHPSEGVGVFAGLNASTADAGAAGQAYRMLSKGASPTAVLDKTGWHIGADGEFKFEIPDQEAKMIDYENIIPETKYPLRLVLDHPELYKAYPELAKLPVQFTSKLPADVLGEHRGDSIALNQALGPAQARSTLLHEIQHAIQHREGFAYGTNSASPEVFQNLYPEAQYALTKTGPAIQLATENIKRYIAKAREADPSYSVSQFVQDHPDVEIGLRGMLDRHEAALRAAANTYSRFAGEVEARNVQARADRPASLTEPWITEDTPRERQIVFKPWDYSE